MTMFGVGFAPRTRKCRSPAFKWINWKSLILPSSRVAATLPAAIAAMTAQRSRLRAEGFPLNIDFVLVYSVGRALEQLAKITEMRGARRRHKSGCCIFLDLQKSLPRLTLHLATFL